MVIQFQLHGSSSPSSSSGESRRRIIGSRFWILDSFVHGEYESSCLRCSGDGINFHHGRFPDTGLKVVSNILLHYIHAIPLTACIDTTHTSQTK